jgi:hypothetical protein
MHQNAQKSKHFLSPTSSMGYAAQGYQSSSSRLPVKIPILICSMVLHAYLFFSALKKNPPAPRTVNYSSGLQVGNRGLHDTSGAFPLCNKFSESSREKRIGITGASNPCVMDTEYKIPILIFPPENVKAII